MLVAASLSVLLGCCLNVISLEYVTKYDAGAGHLLTLAQFTFVAVAAIAWPFVRALLARCSGGCLFGKDAATAWPPVPFSQPLTLPLRAHLQMAVAFFALSVINNKALDFHISMPLHMIFRSSSLVATLLVGALFMRRQYSFGQWFGCALVSVGILAATVADAVSRGKLNVGGIGACCGGGASGSIAGVSFESIIAAVKETVSSFELTWLMGVGLLSIALLMTSFLSFVQEMNFKAHGKNADEALLYSHLLSLPYFLFVADDIGARIAQWHARPALVVSVLGTEVHTTIWVALLVNGFTQYLCISAVFQLLTVSNALTSSLVLTLRKFISLVVSLVFFGHTFTPLHWCGTALVFGGSIAYSHLGDCRCFSRGTEKSQAQPQGQDAPQPIAAGRENVLAQAAVAESNATLTSAAPRRSTRTRNAVVANA